MRPVVLMLALAAAGAVPVSVAARAPATTSRQATAVVEHTYLKALPGERDNLVRFIEQNWFAMYAVGVKQGLFTHYAVYQAADDAGDWDVLVVVGYPTAQGYDAPGTAAAFEAIRKATPIRLIDGKGLAQLGKIIASRRLRPGASDTATER